MEIGIVGLPNVGKSSLFNALTGAAAAAENFPFTTIEPNVGVVPLPDARMEVFAKEWESQKLVPAGIRFVDINSDSLRVWRNLSGQRFLPTSAPGQ